MGTMVQDKVVVVTGAGNGIGRATALLLGSLGAKVVVNDLGASGSGEGGDAGPATLVAQEIIAAGGQAVADTHSVASRESVSYTLASAWRSITAPKSLMKNAAPADSSSTSVNPGLNVQRKLSGSSISVVIANSAAATAAATPAPRRPEKSCAENTTCQKRLLAAATRKATTSSRTVLARSSGRREERARDLDIGAGCGRRLRPA